MDIPLRRMLAASRLEPGPLPELASLSVAEWAGVLRVANRHGMTPRIFQGLRPRLGELSVPPEIRRRMTLSYLKQQVENTERLRHAGHLLVALKRAGIDVIVLKGAHLAGLVHGDVGLRPMVDVDLLVRAEDLQRAAGVAASIGYVPLEDTPGMDHQGAIDENLHIAGMERPGGPRVEFHYAIAVPARARGVDTTGLWARAEPARIGGADALVLSPEDLVLHLCIHVALHHGFRARLVQLRDLPAIVERLGDRIDWEATGARARAWGVSRVLALCFALAERVFGPFVPHGKVSAMDGDMNGQDPVEVAERLLLRAPGKGMGSANLPLLWGRTSPARKAGLVLRRAFPTRDEMAFTYGVPAGSPRIALYYPYRIWELLRRHGGTVGGLVRGDPDATRVLSVERERADLVRWLSG